MVDELEIALREPPPRRGARAQVNKVKHPRPTRDGFQVPHRAKANFLFGTGFLFLRVSVVVHVHQQVRGVFGELAPGRYARRLFTSAHRFVNQCNRFRQLLFLFLGRGRARRRGVREDSLPNLTLRGEGFFERVAVSRSDGAVVVAASSCSCVHVHHVISIPSIHIITPILPIPITRLFCEHHFQ